MKRIITDDSIVGTYVVLKHGTNGCEVISGYHESFVEAEADAAKAAHDNPGKHVMVTNVSLQLIGTEHITVSEVLPAAREPEVASVLQFKLKGTK